MEASLDEYAGKPVGVIVRAAADGRGLGYQPVSKRGTEPRRRFFFFDVPPPRDALDGVTGRKDERIALGRR